MECEDVCRDTYRYRETKVFVEKQRARSMGFLGSFERNKELECFLQKQRARKSAEKQRYGI
jgi:hypothetical protein